MRSAQLDARPAGWGEADHSSDPAVWRQFPDRVATFCLVEIQKLRHDRTEIFTRAVQPVPERSTGPATAPRSASAISLAPASGTYYAQARSFFADDGTCESYELGGTVTTPAR